VRSLRTLVTFFAAQFASTRLRADNRRRIDARSRLLVLGPPPISVASTIPSKTKRILNRFRGSVMSTTPLTYRFVHHASSFYGTTEAPSSGSFREERRRRFTRLRAWTGGRKELSSRRAKTASTEPNNWAEPPWRRRNDLQARSGGNVCRSPSFRPQLGPRTPSRTCDWKATGASTGRRRLGDRQMPGPCLRSSCLALGGSCTVSTAPMGARLVRGSTGLSVARRQVACFDW
jgi:hypothetical protein